jgi:hypothetical protein
MKKNFLLLVFLFALVNVRAQDKFSHWSIGFSAGSTFPTGSFGSKKSSDREAGYARTGVSAEIAGTYAINRSFGIALVVSGQENKYGLFTNITANTILTNTSSQNWKMARILTGGVYTRPFSLQGKLSLRIRLLAGILKTSIPSYSYDFVEVSGQPVSLHETSPNHPMPWTFCYQGDAGLKWKVSKGMSLVADAGYSGARPVYSYIMSVYGIAGQPKISEPAPVGTIHLRVGAEVRL